MKALYHGTTWENFRSIMKHGFNPRMANRMTWNVSEYNYMYFLDWNKFLDLDFGCDLEDEAVNDVHDSIIRRCLGQAQMTATTNRVEDDDRLVVFRLLVPDEFVYNDWSCDYAISTQVSINDLDFSMIDAVYCTDEAYVSDYWFMFHTNINSMSSIDWDEEREIMNLRSEYGCQFREQYGSIFDLANECDLEEIDWKFYLEV